MAALIHVYLNSRFTDHPPTQLVSTFSTVGIHDVVQEYQKDEIAAESDNKNASPKPRETQKRKSRSASSRLRSSSVPPRRNGSNSHCTTAFVQDDIDGQRTSTIVYRQSLVCAGQQAARSLFWASATCAVPVPRASWRALPQALEGQSRILLTWRHCWAAEPTL